jgi:hypothetical protein
MIDVSFTDNKRELRGRLAKYKNKFYSVIGERHSQGKALIKLAHMSSFDGKNFEVSAIAVDLQECRLCAKPLQSSSSITRELFREEIPFCSIECYRDIKAGKRNER